MEAMEAMSPNIVGSRFPHQIFQCHSCFAPTVLINPSGALIVCCASCWLDYLQRIGKQSIVVVWMPSIVIDPKLD